MMMMMMMTCCRWWLRVSDSTEIRGHCAATLTEVRFHCLYKDINFTQIHDEVSPENFYCDLTLYKSSWLSWVNHGCLSQTESSVPENINSAHSSLQVSLWGFQQWHHGGSRIRSVQSDSITLCLLSVNILTLSTDVIYNLNEMLPLTKSIMWL